MDQPVEQSLHYGSPQGLFRFNGIGTALIGRFNDPAMGEWYFKRFAYTVFYVPVYLGRYYAVKSAKRIPGWQVAGWISSKEFKQKYGAATSMKFNLKLLTVPLIIAAAFSALFVYAYQADEAVLHAKKGASQQSRPS